MAKHYLDNWKKYLILADYNYLIKYIENIKNNKPNDKMIILYGPGRSGKTTLKNDIKQYLGNNLYGDFFHPDEIINSTNIKKLEFFSGLYEISNSKKKNLVILNLIKYKQSIISETNNIEIVNKSLLDFSKIIKMQNIF